MDGKMFTRKICHDTSCPHWRPFCYRNFGRKMRIFRTRHSRILYQTYGSVQWPGERDCSGSRRPCRGADLDARNCHPEICQELSVDNVTCHHVNKLGVQFNQQSLCSSYAPFLTHTFLLSYFTISWYMAFGKIVKSSFLCVTLYRFPSLFPAEMFRHFGLRILNLQIRSLFLTRKSAFLTNFEMWISKLADKKSSNNGGHL